jgi:hypothetical protein
MRLSSESASLLAGLLKEVAGVTEERKIWSMALLALASRFGAEAGGIFLHRRSQGDLYKVRSLGEGEAWDPDEALDFFRNAKPHLPDTVLMAPVRAGRRVVGVLALRGRLPFEKGSGKEATEILKALGLWVGLRRDLARQHSECAVANAALKGVRAKDVAYRALHELRRLVSYNHGGTLVARVDAGRGRVVARQVAWSKGRSDLVGLVFDFPWEETRSWDGPMILASGRAPLLLGALSGLKEAGSPAKLSILAAPLAGPDDPLGLVEVSSSVADFFTAGDRVAVAGFLPCLAWCVRTSDEASGGRNE